MRDLPRRQTTYSAQALLSNASSRIGDIVKQVPLIPSTILVIFVVAGVFAPWLSPRDDPNSGTLNQHVEQPFWEGAVKECFLGCDQQGRDVLSRLLHGARISLIVAFSAIAIAGSIGVTLGLTAGYFGGPVDSFIMRLVDIWYALPSILLALILVVVLGPGLVNVIIVIGLTLWAFYARMVRGEVLTVRELDYVALARVAGSSGFRIAVRHILPNVFNSVIIIATLQVGGVILFEAERRFEQDDAPDLERHPVRSVAQLPGAWSSRGRAFLGPDGGRRQAVHDRRLVAGRSARPRHYVHGALLQPLRRLAEGLPRPQTTPGGGLMGRRAIQ